MDARRWERAQTLFHRALELPEGQRHAFVQEDCGPDVELADQVIALLEADRTTDPLLDRSIAEAASHLLEDNPGLAHIGPYRAIRLLGEGGTAVVYLAERVDVGGLVAIKLLRDASLSPARRQRFATEQRSLARLSHPNIARLYDAGTLADGTPYFVMEYVDGLPLTAYCQAKSCSTSERLQLFRALCEAVQFAHGHAIVHRDLKPSNVLVTSEGVVKLLDFGISKQIEDTDSPIEQTATALRLLTPAYAAPEQVFGEPIGTYTDSYTLGVILYELLTGRRPFDTDAGAARPEAMLLAPEVERPSIVARRHGRSDGLPRAAWADLDVLCLTALQREPQRRYRTVEALMRDVEHFLKGEPLEARPDTLGYRLGKFLRRNRGQVAAAVAAIAAGIVLVSFYTVRLAAARDSAVAEAARTQRVQRFMLNLLQGGDEAAGPMDTLRVVTIVDRGVQEARLLDVEPAIQAALYSTLGGIYQKLGNLPRADSLLKSALGARRANAADSVNNLVALSDLRVDQANLPEAERLVQSALQIAERALPAADPQIVKARVGLGRVLMEAGKYKDAATVLEETVQLYSTGRPDTLVLAEILRQLADTQFYSGDYAASDSLNRILLAMHKRIYGERHPLIAEDLIDLGATQQQRGEYVEAERYHRQALEITGEFYGTEGPRYASNLTMIARALVFQDRYDEAVKLLTRAVQVQEKSYGPMHPKVASALNELGSVSMQRNDFAEAEKDFRRVEDIYRKTYGEQHQNVAIALANRASVYMRAGENARAEPIFRDAIRRYNASLGPDHLNTGIARIKLGRTLVRQGRFAEAEPETLAGYAVVSKHSASSVSFLRAAREDLIIVYDSLRMPVKAERFRRELADTVTATAR